MSSTNYVDFSLRQNKSIERLIVFDGLNRLIKLCQLEEIVYVGMGSVWFTDFVLAHRDLGIQTMFSVENDDVIFERAKYNKPYRTLGVKKGDSSAVLQELLKDSELNSRPWIVWLDFDGPMDDGHLEELKYLVSNLPSDSSLLTTFNAQPNSYGKPIERVAKLSALFHDAVPLGLKAEDVNSEVKLMAVLAASVQNVLISRALQGGRKGGYKALFSLNYQDGTPMVTVGGCLPTEVHEEQVNRLLGDPVWPCRVSDAIITPPLTAMEVSALQSRLPSQEMITRGDVRAMGFDLKDEQIKSFVDHYLRYPTFAQITR